MRLPVRTLVRTAALAATWCLAVSLSSAPVPQTSRAPAPATAASDDAFQQAKQIEPAELAKALGLPKASRPLIIQVGFEVLYRGGHVPGAIYAGPASRPAGLAALRRAAAAIPRDREVVIYCGCCPMDKCPNIRPAYLALRRMGFRRIEVLELPNNFARDWAGKKFPVVSGAPR
jgi:thiosulfate/3-mercaptopyruvate sulfurtransferase